MWERTMSNIRHLHQNTMQLDGDSVNQSLNNVVSDNSPDANFHQIEIQHECPSAHIAGGCMWKHIIPGLYISLFAVVGCLIRIGIDHAVGGELANIESPGSVVFRSFFSNMLGCFLLGLVHYTNLSRSSFLYVGLTTGLCGCITTFSKWNQQVCSLLVGNVSVDSQRHLVALSAIMVGLLSFVCSYLVGVDFGKTLFVGDASKQSCVPKHVHGCAALKHHQTIAVMLLLVSSTTGLITLATVLGPDYPFVIVVCSSALLAPFGATLRYAFSKSVPSLNTSRYLLLNEIPMGTLTANILGSCLIAVAQGIESTYALECGILALLMGIQSGFLASLTTVSSFVGELVYLRKSSHHGKAASYLYATITVILCVAVGSVINLINLKLSQESYVRTNNFNISYFQWKSELQSNCVL